jgi:hypothetical protein
MGDGRAAVTALHRHPQARGDLKAGQRGAPAVEFRLIGRAPLNCRAGPGGDRVDAGSAVDHADVDRPLGGGRRDDLVQQPNQLVHGAGTAPVPPRLPARSGHRELHPQRSDRVGEDAVNAVALERQHRLGHQLPAGVTCAAQAAESFLADGEHDHQRQRRPGKVASGDGDGGRDSDGVVTDSRTRKPAVPLGDAARRGFAEHIINVHEHGRPVRRRAERPDQVAGVVDAAAAGCVVQPAQ